LIAAVTERFHFAATPAKPEDPRTVRTKIWAADWTNIFLKICDIYINRSNRSPQNAI
jgi:hypothetical protein